MFARLQKDVGRWRVAGVPVERMINQPGEVSACDRLIASAKGSKDAVTFSQTGNAWTLENDVGLVLKGVLGPNREMVGEVAWNGRVFGSLGTMLQFATPRNWMGAREVTDVRFRRAGSCAEVFITAEGESAERRFALTMRTIVAPGERDFATEIVEVRNVGLVPLKADRIFFRPFAAERPNEEIRQVPNVWKGRTKGYWRLSDGTQYGVESTSPDAKNFCFWLGTRGEQHPDAAFVPSNSVELKPGETWHPQSPLSATVRVLRGETYSVSILGDTHFDAEPESVYHSHYDESNRWAKVQHEEFRRNGEMWRGRCRGLLAASAKLARENPTSFVLQMGDIVQGDCDDVPTHKRMLDDCIRLLRAPYSQDLPFLTVVGNHDVRGKGAREAYFSFAEPFMSKELGQRVRYPVFSFLKGGDLWVFCDFEMKDLSPIIETIETQPGVRHTFLVTHGPFTPAEDSFPVWRLGGSRTCDVLRPKLYELLSRRRAVILSGHSHLTAYYRHENASGGFAEFTANSVWKAPELATADSICEGAAEYGKRAAAKLTDARKTEFETAAKAFRPGLRDYYLSDGAGHARLNVSESGVTVDFYPGAATLPARTFRMK